VINAVQRRLGLKAPSASAAKITASALLKKWQQSVGNTLDGIDVLGDDATPEVRKDLAKQMEEEFLEIQDALDPPPEEGEDESDDSEDDEVGQEPQESQDVTPPPLEAAPAVLQRRTR